MTFIDASVLASVLGLEDDAESWAHRIAEVERPVTSAIAVWETVRAVCRLRGISSARARSELADIFKNRGIELVALGCEEAMAAIDAYDRYGKGNHPAKLNMGDCFAYACARTNGAALFYKGDDFARTDLA